MRAYTTLDEDELEELERFANESVDPQFRVSLEAVLSGDDEKLKRALDRERR